VKSYCELRDSNLRIPDPQPNKLFQKKRAVWLLTIIYKTYKTIFLLFLKIFSVGLIHAFDCNIGPDPNGVIASADCVTAMGPDNYVGCVVSILS
jgi:hypothetical protein